MALRRRKRDMDDEIPPKVRHVIRVPMGTVQKSVYRHHLAGHYVDENGKAAVVAKLQALRVVAATPCSPLLREVRSDDPGPFRSSQCHTPKLAAALNLIRRILADGEQAVCLSAFQS